MNPLLKTVSRFSLIKFIGDNETLPVMRFNRLHRFANGRFAFVIPLIEEALPPVKTSIRVGACQFSDIHTADGIPFVIKLTILFKFQPETIPRSIAAQLVTAPTGTLEQIILDYSDHAVRKVVARFSAQTMLTAAARNQLQQSLSHYLRSTVSPLGLFVLPQEGVLLKEMTPHERYRQNLLMADKWHATLEAMSQYADMSLLERGIQGALVDSLEQRSGDTNLVAPPIWPLTPPDAPSPPHTSLPPKPINGRSRSAPAPQELEG